MILGICNTSGVALQLAKLHNNSLKNHADSTAYVHLVTASQSHRARYVSRPRYICPFHSPTHLTLSHLSIRLSVSHPPRPCKRRCFRQVWLRSATPLVQIHVWAEPQLEATAVEPPQARLESAERQISVKPASGQVLVRRL